MSNFAMFCIFCLSISFRFLIISSVIFDLQEFTIPQIKAKDISCRPYSIKFWAKINIFWNRKQWICLMIFWPRIYKCKKCKIAYFLRNHIFRFLIISLVIFVLQECTIPQIKAKDISFGPYSFSFLAKINILWERKQQSCLVFFYPDLIRRHQVTFLFSTGRKNRIFFLS